MVGGRLRTAVGVWVTEQLAETPLPVSAQLELLKVPAPLLVKLTVPVGVFAAPTSVSLTVAVQVVGWPTTTDAGLQPTLVLVERLPAVITPVEPGPPGGGGPPPEGGVVRTRVVAGRGVELGGARAIEKNTREGV